MKSKRKWKFFRRGVKKISEKTRNSATLKAEGEEGAGYESDAGNAGGINPISKAIATLVITARSIGEEGVHFGIRACVRIACFCHNGAGDDANGE